jgi:ribosomal protein L37AE/L43A
MMRRCRRCGLLQQVRRFEKVKAWRRGVCKTCRSNKAKAEYRKAREAGLTVAQAMEKRWKRAC